ncbi:MAG: hypothetical protein HY000_26275 [Planctomycetes bacterium]|nr:hypothetical protein [Planctomycetota bacterium]
MRGVLSHRRSREGIATMFTPSRTVVVCALVVCGFLSAFPSAAFAQTPVAAEAAAPADAAAQGAVQSSPSGQPPTAAKPGATPPAADGKGQPAGEKPEAKPEDSKKAAEKTVEPVRRPLEPKTPANPDELKVRPDADGRIAFSFKGQPWTAVLEWLADISQASLHWEEAPPGYLDLTTRGRYTPEEIRDLLNSVLLAKGYTLLRNGEVLVVAPTKNLDSSLVPRVAPKELDSRSTHELVRTFFDLDWLVAETVVEEIKPLLSPHGKVSALKATNRLDVLDTAGNLSRIRDLLAEEQSGRGQERLVREFKLRYTRAAEVLEILQSLLGIEKKKEDNTAAMSPQERMMAQQQAMMMAQQQAQMQGRPGAGGSDKKDESKVYLAINTRENSVLANAPPDKMAIIEQAVSAMDVPHDQSQSLLANMPRLQIYRLTGVDPQTIVKVLQDLGGLDPNTRMEVDTKNKAIVAYAPLIDHVMIRSLIDKLDGTGRKFEVVQLRRLSAEYVAGSILLLMRGPEPSNNRRASYPYYFFDPYGRNSSQQEESTDRFQVEADIEHNRLLLRASDAEMAEVHALLVKLGEIPPEGRNTNTVRVVPAMPGEEAQRLLEQIERLWPSVAPNPLDIEKPQPAPEPAAAAPATTSQPPVGNSTAIPESQNRIGNIILAAQVETLANDQQPESKSVPEASARGESAGSPPPVKITVGPQGLIVTSRDTAALDRLEELLANILPQRGSFKVFTLKHTYAKDVAYLLEDIFKPGEQNKSDKSDMFNRFFYGYVTPPAEPGRSSLARRRPLAFIPDPVTNTVLVQGADADQLTEIEWLIQLYDRVEPPDSNSVRRTKMFTLHSASAKQVAEVVKDVYRDLLSPNDKALLSSMPQQPQQGRQREDGYTSIWDLFAESSEEEQKVPRFKGMLSVGVDDKTNTMVVSAPQLLLNDIERMIDDLDKAAEPNRPVLHVLRLGQPGAATQIQQALSGQKRPSTSPPPPQPLPRQQPAVQPSGVVANM